MAWHPQFGWTALMVVSGDSNPIWAFLLMAGFIAGLILIIYLVYWVLFGRPKKEKPEKEWAKETEF